MYESTSLFLLLPPASAAVVVVVVVIVVAVFVVVLAVLVVVVSVLVVVLAFLPWALPALQRWRWRAFPLFLLATLVQAGVQLSDEVMLVQQWGRQWLLARHQGRAALMSSHGDLLSCQLAQQLAGISILGVLRRFDIEAIGLLLHFSCLRAHFFHAQRPHKPVGLALIIAAHMFTPDQRNGIVFHLIDNIRN